jgi:hypothetical protein
MFGKKTPTTERVDLNEAVREVIVLSFAEAYNGPVARLLGLC